MRCFGAAGLAAATAVRAVATTMQAAVVRFAIIGGSSRSTIKHGRGCWGGAEAG